MALPLPLITEAVTGATAEQMRGKILALEAAMLALPKEQQAFGETIHHFAPGIYMRELRIPKGMCLTGKIHKTAHLNILSKGDMTVWTEDGMKRLKASSVIVSLPGIKRAGFAHEDSVWITVHLNPDEERDPDKLEARLVTNTYAEVPATEAPKLIQGGS